MDITRPRCKLPDLGAQVLAQRTVSLATADVQSKFLLGWRWKRDCTGKKIPTVTFKEKIGPLYELLRQETVHTGICNISLLLLRMLKLPSQCYMYFSGLGNLGHLGSNIGIYVLT